MYLTFIHICVPSHQGKAHCVTLVHPPTLTGPETDQYPAPATLLAEVQQGTAVTTVSSAPPPISVRRYLGAEAATAPTRIQIPCMAARGAQHTGSCRQVVLTAPNDASRKGYILTAPDLVPMAMMRSSGSKARALGWLGKPCSTVCGGEEGTCTSTAAPGPP